MQEHILHDINTLCVKWNVWISAGIKDMIPYLEALQLLSSGCILIVKEISL